MSDIFEVGAPGHQGNLKSGGDAGNIGAAGSASGNVDSSGVGAGIGALLGAGLGGGFSLAGSGDAYTGQHQSANGGDVADNTSIGDININT